MEYKQDKAELSEKDIIARAYEVATILDKYAAQVDENATFPEESLQALKENHFMSLLVPRYYGGQGISYRTMVEIAQIFSGACLSTAMIWAMHCQQVAVLVDHAPEPLRQTLLGRIAAEELFVASVTSERGKGGYLFSAQAPLLWDGDDVVLVRDAPVVTGGAHADCYLITMRASEEEPPSSVKLVFASRNQLEVAVSSAWQSLGMRGTQSAGMLLQGRLPQSQIINATEDWQHIAVSTLIPVGHIAWAACWLGAATGLLRRFLHILRDPDTRKQFAIDSDLFTSRLAHVRLQLDMVSAYLKQVIQEYEALRQKPGEEKRKFQAIPYNIHLNNLKILASDTLFEAVNQLLAISGLSYGYTKNKHIPVERVFRDLRSASLMYANDRLLLANGKLMLLDRNVTLA